MELNQLDLNKLHTFQAVAERGGVSAAARALALTPSAVSQSLSGLEAALGVRLFDRVGRRLVPTREGALLQRRFAAVRDALQQVVDEVVNEDREPRGPIRLGLFLGFPRAPLVDFLGRFSRAHPKVSLRLVYGARAELDAALLESRLDLVLSFDPESRAGSRLDATPLFEQELVLVAGRRHAARFRDGFDPEGLAATPVVDYYRGDPLIRRWLAHHRPRRKPIDLDVRVWAATTNLVLDLVRASVGVGVLPSFLVEPGRSSAHGRAPRAPQTSRGRQAGLWVVETQRPPLRDTIWLKERPSAYRGATLDAFREAVLSAFAAR